jgi:hypothetical protein
MCEKFNQTYSSALFKDMRKGRHTGVEEDTGRSGIEYTTDDTCFGAVTVIRLSNT